MPVDRRVLAHPLLDVFHLEGDLRTLRHGDHPQVERERQRCDQQRADEIGPHQPPERHAARQHRHDLGLVGHFRGKEDTGDEGEQSAELVDEEGDEIEVVVEDDGLHGRLHLGEVVEFLDIVEEHHHHDNHGDGEEVRPDELPDDVPVEDFNAGPNLHSKSSVKNQESQGRRPHRQASVRPVRSRFSIFNRFTVFFPVSPRRPPSTP